MRPTTLVLVVAVTMGLSLARATPASALPMFARKHNMQCADCHDSPVFPRLNDVGYKFRRAGFRMPETIGQDELADFAMANYFSASTEGSFVADRDEDGIVSGFGLGEVSLRPINGSFQKYFATQVEVGLGDEGVEIENAYVRGVYGGEDAWLSTRVGVIHPIEGYGALDRPIGVAPPLFEMMSPNNGQDTLTTVIGRDRVGLDLGGQWKNTSLSVMALNRIAPAVGEDGEIVAEGVVGATENGKDILIVGNQIIDGHTGVGFYWDHGRTPLPLDPDGFADGSDPSTWNARFDRLALFASWGTSKVTVLAGGELALEQSRDEATGERERFTAGGGFLECDVATGGYGAAYLRLDYFDPSTSVADDRVIGATAGARLYQNWISLVPELQILRAGTGDAAATTESFVLAAQALY